MNEPLCVWIIHEGLHRYCSRRAVVDGLCRQHMVVADRRRKRTESARQVLLDAIAELKRKETVNSTRSNLCNALEQEC